MKEITRALHRALAEEIGQNFAERLSTSTSNLRSQELAAQFRWYLDHWPDLATLRDFYARAGLLVSGALYDQSSPKPSDQGLREILALNTTIELERAIHEETVAERETGRSSSSKHREGDSGDSKNNHAHGEEGVSMSLMVFRALRGLGRTGSALTIGFSLLAAAVVAGLVLSISHNPVMAVVGGVVVTIVTTIVLAYLSPQTQDQTLLSDMSTRSFDRVLPIVVNRVFDAGLAPIFVVDELDKLEHPFEQINALVKHVKHVISGQCFFCFLTDRSYHSRLRAKVTVDAHAVESTYFARRSLVYFRRESVQKYLESRLHDSYKNSATDLIRSLIQESFLHMSELDRLVRTYTGDATVAPSYSMGLAFEADKPRQVTLDMDTAIEQAFSTPLLQFHTMRDEDFGQILQDALYYPSELWREHSNVKVSLEEIRKFLLRKAGLLIDDTAFLPPEIVRFLYDQVGSIMTGLEKKDICVKVDDVEWAWRIDDFGRAIDRGAAFTARLRIVTDTFSLLRRLDELCVQHLRGGLTLDRYALALLDPEMLPSFSFSDVHASALRLLAAQFGHGQITSQEALDRLRDCESFLEQFRKAGYPRVLQMALVEILSDTASSSALARSVLKYPNPAAWPAEFITEFKNAVQAVDPKLDAEEKYLRQFAFLNPDNLLDSLRCGVELLSRCHAKTVTPP